MGKAETKTLKEWAIIDRIKILDADGFDRSDNLLFERQFTHDEYMQGIYMCTVCDIEDDSFGI